MTRDNWRVMARSLMSRPAHKTYSAGADAARIIAVAFPAKIDDVAPAQLRGDLRFVAVASASTKPDKQWDSAKVFPKPPLGRRW